MRIHALIICMLICVASAFAKDVITKTDGTKLDAKVEEITETVIKFRKAANPIGPVYTIPISLVATILYENGDIDTFNAHTMSFPVSNNGDIIPSDDDLIKLSESQIYDNQSGSASDVELLRIASLTPYHEIMNKAKKYRKIGLYGGCGLLIVGVGLGITCACCENYEGFAIGLVSGVIAGGLWYFGFNYKLKSLINQASKLQSYSATLLENEIMQVGDNKLTAGINLMGNRTVNSHSLGVSLGLNF